MEGGATSWEKVTNTTGKIPPPISHHSGFLYKDTLYIYGGLVEGDSNKNIFALNLNSLNWSIVEKPADGVMPTERDDHAASLSDDGESMYVVGGYVRGGKSNDLW